MRHASGKHTLPTTTTSVRDSPLRSYGERLCETYRYRAHPSSMRGASDWCGSGSRAVASQNAETVKNLRTGMLVSTVLSILVRLLFQRGALSPKRFAFWVYVLSLGPSVFLSRYLERIGSPRHDPTTGTLIHAGEDLNHPGIIEWCFDVVYVTCECTLRT